MNGHDYLRSLPEAPRLHTGGSATLLLGTDRHIGVGSATPETRVAITPNQAAALRAWVARAGIAPTLYVVQDAGIGSGYHDDDYRRAGAIIISEDDLPALPRAPDVVHALKEPCQYEAAIPGPFMRIGALHSGTFHAHNGLAALLRKRNFCAIFDGSAVGGHSYKMGGGYSVPLRSSMSVFAGTIAADLVLENPLRPDVRRAVSSAAAGTGWTTEPHAPSPTHPDRRDPSRFVIAGGGIVGLTVARRILEQRREGEAEILVVEADATRCDQLRRMFGHRADVRVEQGRHLDAADLRGASGLVLAAFSPGVPAPKVVDVQALSCMATGGAVVDVAIDEGGSITCPAGAAVAREIEALGNGLTYVGDTHMPRKYPAEASEAHGRASLPYLAVLLYLAAREGGAMQAAAYIQRQRSEDGPADYFTALVHDLRSGLALSQASPICVNSAVVKDTDRVVAFLAAHRLPLVVQ